MAHRQPSGSQGNYVARPHSDRAGAPGRQRLAGYVGGQDSRVGEEVVRAWWFREWCRMVTLAEETTWLWPYYMRIMNTYYALCETVYITDVYANSLPCILLCEIVLNKSISAGNQKMSRLRIQVVSIEEGGKSCPTTTAEK